MSVYTDEDQQRRCPESTKQADTDLVIDGGQQLTVRDCRSTFAHDRARILHCGALRRLADKTQVVGPQQGDVPRTRLTHSLEVGQIAGGIAAGLGVNHDLAELAGLAHDIGHPPYGHNGETALNEVAAPCGGFEGNAQTLRILTRLETKVVSESGDSVGLNLCRASLDAVAKYPWKKREGCRKYGAYYDDAETLAWIRRGAPSDRKCVEAQIMDWSDDIAYSVHDVEDGILAGRIDLRVLGDAGEAAALAEDAQATFGLAPDEVAEAAERLWQMPLVQEVARGCVQHGTATVAGREYPGGRAVTTPLATSALRYDGSRSNLVALKKLTSELVGRFVNSTIAHTLVHYEGPIGRYHGSLMVPEGISAEVGLLKTIAVRYVMHNEDHLRAQERQRDRIFRVSQWLYLSGEGGLDSVFAEDWRAATAAGDDAARWRIVVDQIASYTESRLERVDKAAADLQSSWG